MRRSRRKGKADINANLTSLIDVTFLLIIFFVLVSRITEDEHVEMNLPRPQSPATLLPGADRQVVVNVVPGAAGEASAYRVGSHSFNAGPEDQPLLVAHLAALYRATPDLRVSLRADRATHYAAVEPALEAIGRAARQAGQAPRVNLVILREG